MKVKPQKKNIKFISITMTLFLKETNLSRKDAVNKDITERATISPDQQI